MLGLIPTLGLGLGLRLSQWVRIRLGLMAKPSNVRQSNQKLSKTYGNFPISIFYWCCVLVKEDQRKNIAQTNQPHRKHQIETIQIISIQIRVGTSNGV